MRKIKFRAWSKEEKRIVKPYSFWQHPSGGIELNSEWVRGCESVVGDSDDYILMQYAGLKDKDRKDIYEGDIIEYKNSIESGVGVITHFFKTINLHVEWISQKTNSPSIYCSLDYMGCEKEIKIIGNIYENPELLESEGK